MRISDRLKCVADNVSKNSIVADIGCDHAYTSIYLVKNGIAPYVYAMDVNAGPLMRACENVRIHGVEKNISVILSYGLREIKPEYNVDCVLISGMGGNLMIDILKDADVINSGFKELVLQPQSHIRDLRLFLHNNGYKIINEDMIYEDGKFYNIIKADKGVDKSYSEIEYEYGKILINNRNEIFIRYLKYIYDKNLTIIDKINEAGGRECDINELHNKNKIINEIIGN